MLKQNPAGKSANEGEGNKTAARQYNEERSSESGKVEEKGREAKKALGPEKDALQKAEEVGKRHSAGEDPAVKRQK